MSREKEEEEGERAGASAVALGEAAGEKEARNIVVRLVHVQTAVMSMSAELVKEGEDAGEEACDGCGMGSRREH